MKAITADVASPDIRAHKSDAAARPFLVAEKSRDERWITFGLFLLSCLYLWLFGRYTAIDPDEGITLQAAQRILEGQVLYRDFFSYFTPGSYYLTALLFKICGSSMLVARTALVVYGGFFTVFTYLMARRVCSRRCALLTACLVILTCLPWRFMALHNWDSTLWACATLYCAMWLVQEPHWGWAVATGSLASLTVLFEQSKGAGLILGLALGFAVIRFSGKRGGASTTPTEGRQWLSRAQWIALGAGLAWPFVVTFAYFGAHHALPALWADWAWPLHHYTRANTVPYGYQEWSSFAREEMLGSGPLSQRLVTLLALSPSFLLPVLPIIAIVLLFHWVLAARRGHVAAERAAYYVLVCSSIAGLLLSVIVVRANIIHFVYLIPIFYLVVAWFMDGADILSPLVSLIKPAATVCLCIAFTALGMAFLLRNSDGRRLIETRRGTLRAAMPDAVLEYTQAHVPSGSRILVYPYLPLYYFLTATFSPTCYEYLQPGMHTREQEEEAIRQIAADNTPVVLFEPAFTEAIPASWPNTPLEALAKDAVADYILQHYRSCRVLKSAGGWSVAFMVRKDLGCPSSEDHRIASK